LKGVKRKVVNFITSKKCITQFLGKASGKKIFVVLICASSKFKIEVQLSGNGEAKTNT